MAQLVPHGSAVMIYSDSKSSLQALRSTEKRNILIIAKTEKLAKSRSYFDLVGHTFRALSHQTLVSVVCAFAYLGPCPWWSKPSKSQRNKGRSCANVYSVLPFTRSATYRKRCSTCIWEGKKKTTSSTQSLSDIEDELSSMGEQEYAASYEEMKKELDDKIRQLEDQLKEKKPQNRAPE